MSKPLMYMSMVELIEEMEAWQRVIKSPQIPGGPNSAAREAAQRMFDDADAWYHRRHIESKS